MVSIDVWAKADELEAKKHDAFVAVERATGRGLADEHVSQLVEAFHEADRECEAEVDRLLR